MMYIKFFKASNLENVEYHKCYTCLMKDNVCEEPSNIFKKSIRDSESTFALYSEEETKRALEILEDLIKVYGEDYLKDLIKSEKKMYGVSIQISGIKPK